MASLLNHPLGFGDLAFLLLAGLAGGVFNGVAGGGTLAVFPALLAVGYSPLTANITSSIGIFTSYLGGLGQFREEIGQHRRDLRALLLAMVAGTLIGCTLLLTTSTATFRELAPWLVGFATVLFVVQPWIAGHLHRAGSPGLRRVLLQAGTFILAIYGGYFAAGVGIMLLVLFGITMAIDRHAQTAMRMVVSVVVQVIAATVFVFAADYDLAAAAAVGLGALIGGTFGARLARRLPAAWFRVAVVLLGCATTLRLALA